MLRLEKVCCPTCGMDDPTSFQKTQTMMASQVEIWNFDKCNYCSMVYLNPRVEEQDIERYYREDYLSYRGGSAWGKYKKLVDSDQLKVDKRRVATLKKYSSSNLKSVLDVGCGKPTFLKEVQEELSIECTGIDFSDHGWSDETEKYKSINLEVGELLNIPEEKKYDAITMWQYMEHDYHPHVTLTKLLKHSHNETRIIVEIPCIDSDTRKLHGAHWAGYHSPRHTGLFTPETLKILMDRSGWHMEEAYTYGTLDAYILDWMSRMEKQNINWTESMESRFVKFVLGKIVRPSYFWQKLSSKGFMTAIARPK